LPTDQNVGNAVTVSSRNGRCYSVT
jgi:hypothetical protein